jgi:hypothetical protein
VRAGPAEETIRRRLRVSFSGGRSGALTFVADPPRAIDEGV